MAAGYLYISNQEYFQQKPLPPLLDRELIRRYPLYGEGEYDLCLSVVPAPTAKEKASPIYNPWQERFGRKDLAEFCTLVADVKPARVCLMGLNQKQLLEVIPHLKDSVKQLYLFKCRSVKDLTPLSHCKELECFLMYGNYGVNTLWNLDQTPKLTVVSLEYVTGIRTLANLEKSGLAYFSWDSRDLSGHSKGVLEELPPWEALSASYVMVNCENYKVHYEK